MAFIQVIEFRTSNVDEVQAMERDWEQATDDKRTLRRSVLCRDRNDPSRCFVLAFFDSYESAMVNSELPETAAFAKRLNEIVEAPPEFHDLDVIEDRS